MKRKKIETKTLGRLVSAATSRMEETTKRQMHSLLTLLMTTVILLTPYSAAAASIGPVEYNVFKNATAVNGILGGNVTKAGDNVTFQILVNNPTVGKLTNVTVDDTMIGLHNVTNLSAGESVNYTGYYIVTPEDMNNNGTIGTGFIINNVTVVCDQNSTANNATASVPIANCTIVKTVESINGNSTIENVTAAGDKISYKIKVDNKGQVNLTNVTVTDPLIGLLNVTSLGIGSNETLFGNYTVTQADIDNNGNGTGFILNNATVYSDQLGSKNATAIAPIRSCTIIKTVTGVTGDDGGNVTAAGDIISYQININNTAGMDLTNVTVTDPMLGGLLLNMSNFAIGSNQTVYGNYIVTQDDINNNGTIDSGFIMNNATVDSDQLGPKNATASVPVVRNPAYTIFKSVISPDNKGDCIVNSKGDDIPYRIVVKNEGNVDLTNLTVNDTLFSVPVPSGDENEDGILNPGETWLYEKTYYLTQDDVDNGNVNNNATVICDQLPEKSSSVDTPVTKNAELEIYKTATGIDEAGDHIINQVDDVINYQVAVKNSGDVKLTEVSVDDPMVILTKISGDQHEPGVLNPGEIWVYTGNYAVTPEDIDSARIAGGIGSLTNTATVSCNELKSSEISTLELPIIILPKEPVVIFPFAKFSTSVTSGYAPLSVQFTDKSQNAAAWNWDFNSDGTVDSTAQSPAYVYNNPGTYVAKLTVSDVNGTASEPATATINVLQAATTPINKGGSSSGGSGGRTGGATVISSSGSTVSTPATANVAPADTTTPTVEPTTTPTTVQAPEPKNTTTPTKPTKRTPGFEIVGGIIGLLGAVYQYRRR